jgi:outer membrane lipoprotein-sorting protein
MTDDERQFVNFVRQTEFDDTPDANHRDRLEQHLLRALGKRPPRQIIFWRIVMKSRIIRFAAATVIVIVVLGGVTFWPSGGCGDGKWWLGSPAAWGQEIINSLEKVEALVYRVQTVFVGTYASTHISGNWRRCHKARKGRREDTYYDDKLVGIQWNVPDGDGEIRYDVSFEYECYTVHRYEGGGHGRDPVSLLRLYVDLFIQGEADRELGTQIFEGRECVGFEISASKYGSNPEGWIDRIWFDVDTKLPLRIEKHGRPVTGHPEQTFTFIEDEFEYYAQVPAEMFTPEIPEGFVNKHPDEIRAAREKEEKGEMPFAEVPRGLKEEVIAAFKEAEAVTYREYFEHVDAEGSWSLLGGADHVYASRHEWRIDYYLKDEQLQRVEWYVVDKGDWGQTSFQFNDENFLVTRTILNYENNTCKEVSYDGMPPSRHPLDNIMLVIGHIDKADKVLENTVIEGLECFGLEISAKKYGNSPDGVLHRLWLDTETKLPVRMEFERPSKDGAGKNVRVRDEFEWNCEMPADAFIPDIPEDFIHLRPERARPAAEQEQQGEMIFAADVPPGLQDEIIGALNKVETVVYRQVYGLHVTHTYVSENALRRDLCVGHRLQRIEWHVVGKKEPDGTASDAGDLLLSKTTVNFVDKTYETGPHQDESGSWRPVEDIRLLKAYIHRADGYLDSQQIEGIECFGLEVSAQRHGTNPNHFVERLWFDKETKLPVRMEFGWIQNDGPRKRIKDQFEWNPDLPPDTFIPTIPDGFKLVDAGGS